MSALTPFADLNRTSTEVREVPKRTHALQRTCLHSPSTVSLSTRFDDFLFGDAKLFRIYSLHRTTVWTECIIANLTCSKSMQPNRLRGSCWDEHIGAKPARN